MYDETEILIGNSNGLLNNNLIYTFQSYKILGLLFRCSRHLVHCSNSKLGLVEFTALHDNAAASQSNVEQAENWHNQVIITPDYCKWYYRFFI